ncbi:dolabradiene monooxygenase-like [Phragmites australis]|uniref:dolabradiene monooxygenase-like n=1 Tax=Phragmites australis TaxID=29695 RepID=UPI002D77B228|nr:dolabradiene monooxygenase-like [Phragmites australis]
MEATLPLLLLLVLLLLFLVKLVAKNHSSPPLRLPPGPWQLPLVGSLHHLLLSRHGDLAHRTLRELSGEYGPLMMLRLGAVPTLVVSSAEAAREVMKTHDAAFASRHQTPTMDVFSCGGRDILFSPYGDLWRQLRRLCVLELFSARQVESFRRIREEEAAGLLRSVADTCAAQGGGAVVDIGERICRAMNDSVARSALGARCARRDEFLRELHRAAQLVGGFNLADLYPSSRLARWLSRALRESKRCNRNVRDIMGDIIREHAVDDTGDGVGEEENLLAVLLRLQRDGDAQCPLTTEIITTLIMEILAAGSETSSTTLEWAMSELTRNPRVLLKAQAEVREAFKGKDKPTEDDLQKLSYLPLVVKEAMRLHIPVPFLLPRVCRETCRVMGYDIPKGTKVLVNAWAIARDGKYWEEPEAFKPERFERNNVGFNGVDFEYIPFGAGRRMCPGMALGLTNMELALASLLYHFDWELPDGKKKGEELDMSEACGLTAKRKSKLVLHATTRIPCTY